MQENQAKKHTSFFPSGIQGIIPIVITVVGIILLYFWLRADAAQNLTEALLACRLVAPGIYVAMHNRVLRFPGVVKDSNGLSFEKRVVPEAG